MCGIVGIWQREGDIDGNCLKAASDSLRHRGPDDAGTLVWPEVGVGLSHRRLAIIDLSPLGHQPMTTGDGKLAIVFNGEIYNFAELRTELEALGHVFKSRCDTEAILLGYQQWGNGVVRRLNGQFAFAIVEKSTGRIFMARDRAGEKPLFYYWDSERLIFASEIKAILAFREVDRRFSLDVLNAYLAYGYVPGHDCLVRNVWKLPAGHTLEFADGRIDIKQYWSVLDNCGLEYGDRSEEELVSEFEFLLRDSVRRQLIADVPAGILLSGGLDSSLVTAVAAQLGNIRLRTFTITFPGHGAHNEASHARLIAKAFGTDHHELEGTASEPGLLQKLAIQYDEPMADSSMIPTFMVSQLVRRHCKVALGGDGGDELFGGYNNYTRSMALMGVARWAPKVLRDVLAGLARTYLPVGLRGRNYLMAFGQITGKEIPFPATRFDLLDRQQVFTKAAWNNITDLTAPETSRNRLGEGFSGDVAKMTGVDFLTYLPDDILVKVDRASMLCSLEVRAPFLDHRMIEFAFSKVPAHMKINKGIKKILPKLLGRKLLPKEFSVERKQGFSIPLSTWLRSRWRKEFREHLSELPSDIFNKKAIDRLWIGEGRSRNNSERIFALALFSIWAKAYGFRP